MTTNPLCENKQEPFLNKKTFPSVESSKEVTTEPVFKDKQEPASALSVTYVTKHSKRKTFKKNTRPKVINKKYSGPLTQNLNPLRCLL